MRKFFISFAGNTAIEKNANEYSVYPKTNTFPALFDAKEITAAFTSGKGKSAIPNYYLYFRDSANSIFYFRSNPAEIEEAKKGFAIYSTEPADETPAADAEDAIREAAAESRIEAGDDSFTEVPAEVARAKSRRRARA